MTAPPDTALLERAEALAEIGRYEQAGELFARLVAADPGSAPGWTGLARCRARLGDPRGALPAVEEALRADPEYVQAVLMRGNILADLGRHTEAVAAALEGVRIAPEAFGAHLVLARALLLARTGRGAKSREMREAYVVANNAVRLAPEEPATHYVLGVVAHQMRRHDLAEQAYNNALRLDPGHTDARNNLSVLHMERRLGRRSRFGMALEGFADVAAADLEDGAARFNLEAMLFNVVARARWVGLLSLLTGMTGALASGAGRGVPPQPGDLLPRLVTVLLIAGLWTLWALRIRSCVPRRLHAPLWALGRRCRPVTVMAGAVALLALVSVLLVAVPWTHPAVMGATIAPSVWLTVLVYWGCRAALRRRKPKD